MGDDNISEIKGKDFLRQIINEHIKTGKYDGKVITRFPPEPNGYLHIGHAKSICINFGIAKDYPGGICHLRMDDSDPTKESYEYVNSIKQDVKWIGFDWGDKLFFASDYFEKLYEYAEFLIKKGKAYVCSLSESEIREYRGTVTEPGKPSPYRNRSVEENLDLFRRMKAGEFKDSEHVLRAKIDMSNPNMKMRDPLLYRIRHVEHYRQGNKWCIYPLYDFTHCLSDAMEGITHSICTLEFENNRELYDWILDECEIKEPRPHQYEFARLNINYTVMSKRRLLELVEKKYVSGWDDPRMPTISGLRRRGVTPEALRSFCENAGIAKANSIVDIAQLEYSIRDDLNKKVPRVLAVLRPLKIVIENYSEHHEEMLDASYYPHDVPLEGARKVPFSREIYIEKDDFMENPSKGFYRLSPGEEVRLRHAYIIKCERVIKNNAGEIIELRCSYDPTTKSGEENSEKKVKGIIHWVSIPHSQNVEVRLYDRLFNVEHPETIDDGFNEDSFKILSNCYVEPAVAKSSPGSRFQFERLGYFYLDPIPYQECRLVFNRIVTLRDSWTKISAEKPEKFEKTEKQIKPQPQEKSEFDMSELPLEVKTKLDKYLKNYDIHKEEALTIAKDETLADFYEQTLSEYNNPKGVAGIIAGEMARELKEKQPKQLAFTPKELGELVKLIDDEVISVKIAREVFSFMIKGEGKPSEIVEKRGLKQITDPSELGIVIDTVIKANPENVEAYKAGKTKLFGFFTGQVMKESGGRAKPELLNELLKKKLN
ncbi:MAG TPA: glutamine--tRNA ligase/YqeY domain fusion protein [Candidatus Gastranaerophilales bacterium]|nr:glutamine--tRNA ligase/YqeY domain fusion protein [Candidatus Gastranaerophilales bacterium]